MQDSSHRRGFYNQCLVTGKGFVAQASNFFTGQARHYCDPRNVGRSTTKTIVLCRDVHKRGFGNLLKFSKSDSGSKKCSGQRPQRADEKCVEYLALSVVLHGGEIYGGTPRFVNEISDLGKMTQVLPSKKRQNDCYFWMSCRVLEVDFIGISCANFPNN